MRSSFVSSSRSFGLACSLALGLLGSVAACGSSSTPNKVDAAVVHLDTGVTVDAPPSTLTGLGQKCGTGMPACPANAPGCLTSGAGAVGFCSAICHAGAMFKTDAAKTPGMFTDTTADNPKCAAIFTGTVGTAECTEIVNVKPAPPLVANTTYTFDAACGIVCGAGNTCPGGLTCDTTTMLCNP
jgi:hypothetical protein